MLRATNVCRNSRGSVRLQASVAFYKHLAVIWCPPLIALQINFHFISI
jgi:hypothetical protein